MLLTAGSLIKQAMANRPSHPDALHTHAFTNQSVIYVSDADLQLWRGLEGGAIILLTLGGLLVNRHTDLDRQAFVMRWRQRGMPPPW